MESIGDRINFLRRQEGKSYNDLALVLENITADGMRKMIVNDRLKEVDIEILSKAYHWNIDWIKKGGDIEKKNVSPQHLLKTIDNKEIIAYIYNNRSDFQKLSMYNMLIDIESRDSELKVINERVDSVESKLKKITD